MLGEFLALVRAGEVPKGSYLLVESLDRLSRNTPRKAVRLLEDICVEGITLVTLADGKVYDEATLDDDPMAFMWAFMVAIRANEESAMKSRRGKAAWEHKRAQASQRPLTAKAPHWLKLNSAAGQFEVIEERAAVVRRIFAMTLEGAGQHKIAETLNREGVATFGTGRHWHRSYIAKLLQNSAVVGTLVPHSIEYEGRKRQRRPQAAVEGYYPIILDRAMFDHVQAMSRNARSPLRGRHAASGTVSNLFGGLSKCPLCGGTMTRVSKGPKGGKAYLVCAKAKAGGGCRYRAVLYERVEKAFIQDVFRVIATAPAGDAGADIDADIEHIDASMSAIEDMIRNLMEGIERGRASMIERQRVRDLESEHEALERRRAELLEKRATVAGPLVDQRLNALQNVFKAPALDRRQANAILRQVFSQIEVDYRRGDLILDWKHGGLSYVVFAWPEEEIDYATVGVGS